MLAALRSLEVKRRKSARETRLAVTSQKGSAAKAAAEAEANKPETTEQILNDIRELLKSLQPAQAAAIQKSVDKATADKQ